MDRDKCQLCKSGVINLKLAKKDGQLMCDDCRIMTEFEELKKEMRARLAYYFDTDEHEPITPEIVEEWMGKAISIDKKENEK